MTSHDFLLLGLGYLAGAFGQWCWTQKPRAKKQPEKRT